MDPKEGDLKYIGDVEHVYKDGAWTPSTPASNMQQQVINAGKSLWQNIKGGAPAEAAPTATPSASPSPSNKYNTIGTY